MALVNNDMELHPDFLGELVAALDAAPGAAAATAKMLGFDDRGAIDGTGDVLRWSGVVMPRGRGERDRGQYDAPAEVFSACGGAALYRRAAFDDVGLFDEAFFAQMEDVDWGFRARLLGYGCRYVPGAVAYHKGSASMRREGRPDPVVLGAAGAQLHLDVDQELPARLPAAQRAPAARARAGRPLLRGREGMARAQLRAWRDALRGLPRVLRQRREIQSRRRIGRRELDRVIQPEVVGWRRLGALVRHGRPAPGAR